MSWLMPLQAYELKLAPQPAPFSVVKFAGIDKISQLYKYEIEFTSPTAGIQMDQVLGRPARFIVDPIDPNMGHLQRMFGENAEQFSKKPPAQTVHGIITKFDELETSADETRYRVRLEPAMADLNRGVTSRLFQKQSIPEIVNDTLRHEGYRAGVDFKLNLRGTYKRHEYITQYHETTFAFIQRICAEEGIWFRWEQKKDYAVMVFGDDLEGAASGFVQCLYRTTQAVTLQPVSIAHAGPAVRHDGRSVIRLAFELQHSARREETDLSRLRLHLNADLPVAFAMHLALTRQVDTVLWRIPEVRDGEAVPLPGITIEPAGFSTEERLWPKADAAFSGYQLLLEYFSFRDKFLFVDLCGLDVAKLPPGSTRFELEVVLKEAYPSDLRFTRENVRLFCSPVINLFELDAEPVEINHHETEYRVVPAGHHGEHVETYSVDAVSAFDHETAERYEYVPFATFRHRGGMLRHEAPERYFHGRVRQGVSGLHETWIVLGGHAWETMETLPEESLSLRVTGTNGMLPRKGLREANLSELAASTPNLTGVRNLVAPTLPLYPPTDDRFQWRVLSHLAPNFLSLMDAEVLRGALALYDWTGDELNRRRLAGILWVSEELLEEVAGGSVERGVQIEVTLDSQAFAGEGDVMLFGELLHRFFAMYAEINLFTRLSIVSLPSQKRTLWPRSKAERSPL